jgi:hypothetical protein
MQAIKRDANQPLQVMVAHRNQANMSPPPHAPSRPPPKTLPITCWGKPRVMLACDWNEEGSNAAACTHRDKHEVVRERERCLTLAISPLA